MMLFGDTSRFALGFELLSDPDAKGRPEDRASWARLQIWVAGRNLTAGRDEAGSSHGAAEVPLAPIVQWMVLNWDAIFHQERLPRPTQTNSAAAWRGSCLATLPDDETVLDSLLQDREQWWKTHALGSALPGFRVPDLHIRRYGQRVELSWDDGEWRSVPRGMQLVEPPGSARLPADEVATACHEWATAVAKELADQPGLAAFTKAVREGLDEALHPSTPLRRLELAAGQALRDAANRLRGMAGVVDGKVEDTLGVLLGLEGPPKPGLITDLTVPVLLYRSASPRLSTRDLESLLILCKDAGDDTGSLARYQQPCSPPARPEAITADGYRRALVVRERLGVTMDAPLLDDWDLEEVLLRTLGVSIRELQLDDEQVQGVAAKAPSRQAVIAINRSGRFARTRVGRRMTLAHELCHLLFDIDEQGRIGVVSNPWAPSMLERRANAFAAMLLLPEQALARRLPRDSGQWTVKHLQTVMQEMGVGKSTLTWHLHNLGWIAESEREAWVDSL